GSSLALLDPLAHLADELGVRQRRPGAAFAGVPAGQHRRILLDVMQHLGERLAAVLLGVLQLAGQLAGRLALDHHANLTGPPTALDIWTASRTKWLSGRPGGRSRRPGAWCAAAPDRA